MQASTKFNFSMFEHISEHGSAQLKGGFSASYAAINDDDSDGSEDANNCLGGNCSVQCGYGGQNISCNVAAGCGG